MTRKNDFIITTDRPALRKPHMVCGISGWMDGGEVATGSIWYMVNKLAADEFAEIPINRFHIFQIAGQTIFRPYIKLEDGLLKEHQFPRNRFFYWVNPSTDHDLILFIGTEPNLRWQEYADTIVKVAREFDVARIYSMGGVLDKIPHTKEPGVSCSCSSPRLKKEMDKYGVTFSNYEGPGSFTTTLLHTCQHKRIPMVSLTARVTYYPEFNIVVPRNPKTIRALVGRLNHLLGLNIDLSDLNRETDDFEAKLDFMVSQNNDFKAYVKDLEKEFVEISYDEPLGISGDEAVRIAEAFLRKGRKKD
ncbi:PAC2 family protein [Chloroflexota bacterium]